jgi:DNA-binding winged helix-turn-helix (wHTH) protein/tetratricopeptide (TPR) repeat protein
MSQQIASSYEFGPFRLVPSERQLLQKGRPVALPPKAFDTLLILVQRSGHALRKEELIEMVWPDAFVEESNLNHYISLLRRTLGHGVNRAEYIETVRGYGFRFTANVCEINDEASAVLIHKHTRAHIAIREEHVERVAVQTSPVLEQRTIAKRRRVVFAALVVAVTALLAVGFVVRALEFRATNQRALALAKRPENAEAYQDYLKGRALWNKRTAAGLFESVEHFQRAIDKDSDFALGYAGLADAYAFDLVRWRQATEIANKALAIDSSLAEPHATLGFIHGFWEWRKDDAEREFKQAIKQNPNYATAHQWYAIHLAVTGRYVEAEIEMQRALELEPLSPVMNSDMGQILYFNRKYDEAIAACKKALTIDQSFFNAHQYLYEIYTEHGLYDDAVREFFEMVQTPGASTGPLPADALKNAYSTEGIRGFWKALALQSAQRDPDSYETAQCYARLGERDKALYWLQQAVERHDFKAIFASADPAFDSIRGEADFRQVVRQLGLAWPT